MQRIQRFLAILISLQHWQKYRLGCILFSGLIILITLCQCGRGKKKESKSEYLRWAIHDLILGSIWLALSFQFHDVVDDYDDSHWRHLFSSMIVFHIIILLFDIMGNPKYQINWDDPELTLWSKASKPAIREMSRFLFYSIIYYCILTRLHESDILLVSMTIDINSSTAVIVSSGCLILINLTEYKTVEYKEDITLTDSKRNANTKLRSGVHRLNFLNSIYKVSSSSNNRCHAYEYSIETNHKKSKLRR